MTTPEDPAEVSSENLDRAFTEDEMKAAAARVGGEDYNAAVDQLARYLDTPADRAPADGIDDDNGDETT